MSARSLYSIGIDCLPIDAFAWPDGKRCGVSVGWHVKVGSPHARPPHPVALSEVAYGTTTALPRIIELHRRYEIPATFFLPSWLAEHSPALVDALVEADNEIALHGVLHENVQGLGLTEQHELFARAASVLESRTGRPPLGWSAPSWGLRAETFDVLVSLGLVYDASLMEYDRPHRVRCGDAELIELPISTVLDDWALFGASLDAGSTFAAPAAHALEIWGEEFDGLRSVSGYFNSTFHPHLSGRPGRLRMLERLFRHMRTFDDVWFGTCAQAAMHAKATLAGTGGGHVANH